jgi:hypothetical protein
MSKRRIRGRVTLQKDRVRIVRIPQEPVVRWYPECQCRAEMLIPEEAAKRRGVSPRTIYRWMDLGTLHFLEYPGGMVLVCLNSMSDQTGGV